MLGKKILVTGGNGFLGRHLCAKLRDMGADLYVPLHKDYDLTHELDALRLFADLPVGIDYIFHLAAHVGGIHYNSAYPATLLHDNLLMGALTVRVAAAVYPDAYFLCVGSVCAYPKQTPVPFNERNLWQGYPEESNGAYGVAKRVLHALMSAYRQEHGLRGAYVLLTNLYGPGDDFDPSTSHVIPALIRKFSAATDAVEVWGSGNASRDFLFVEDAVDALITISQNYDSSDPINAGSGSEVTISWLAQAIANLCGFTGDIVYNDSKPDGQPRRMLNIAGLRALGWKPKVSMAEGLARTIKWWKKQDARSESVRR